MKDRSYAINGRSRGLVAIPVGEVPTGLRCVQINIPDSDASLRMLAGMLYELTHWSNYQREGTHLGTQWAQAWRDALLASVPFDGCSTMALEFRQDDCGLFVSTDGWATETQIYDGLACLASEGGILAIQDAASDLLDQFITDGTLDHGAPVSSPTTPPPSGECRTYHVRLRGREQWLCPFPVQAGDTVQVTNTRGGWCDGGVSGIWTCANGQYYFLSVCGQDWPPSAGDPLQTANHMCLIAKVGASTYGNPTTGMYTIPSPTPPSNLWLMANDSNIADNQGEIEFDVSICNNGGGWCFHMDFTQDAYGFARVAGQNYGTWEAGVGWKSDKAGYTHQIYIERAMTAFPWTAVTLKGTNPHNSLYRVQVMNGSTSLAYTSGVIHSNPWVASLSFSSPSTTAVRLAPFQSTGVPADYEFTMTDGWFYGTGSNPFGSNNC